jgi:hypothetical protein
MLSHEKLDVYQHSIEFLACALKIAETLPRGQPSEIAPGSRRRDAQQDVVSADADEDEDEDEDGYDDEDGARRN